MATMVARRLPALSLALWLLAACLSRTWAIPCDGMQNIYVCHPHDPGRFQICIGAQVLTQNCPGGLHFNTKSQTCDWPHNADCGKPKPPPTRESNIGQRGGFFDDDDNNFVVPTIGDNEDKSDEQRFPEAPSEQPKVRNPYTPADYHRKVSGYTSRTRVSPSRDFVQSRRITQRYWSRRTTSFPTPPPPTYATPRRLNRPTSPPTSRRWRNKYGGNNDSRRFSLVFNKQARRSGSINSVAAADHRGVREDAQDYLDSSRHKGGSPRTQAKSSSVEREDKWSLKTYPWWADKTAHTEPAKPQTPTAQVRPTERVPAPPEKRDDLRKTNKKPKKSGKCDPATCQLPECRCIGTDIPGGLPVKKTPMMVMLTFDDSVNVANFDYYVKLFDGKFRNPNGCPVHGTFFVSGDASEYHFVTKLHKGGNEIASHSMSHREPTTWWATAGYKGFHDEIEGQKQQIARKSDIPASDIQGMRVPFLQVGGDDQYDFLDDYEYLYDSSMVAGALYQNDEPPIWPFTLDYAPDSKSCNLAPCPTKSHPGLWEVPLIRWYGSNRVACAMPDACLTDAGRAGSLTFLRENFRRHYETNKSPLGIFIHASWFRRKDGNFEALMDFLQEVSQMDDVWVLTVKQVLDWVRNPLPMEKVASIQSWGC